VSRVTVIDVDHFLQNLESLCMTPAGKESEARQKAALNARLVELISQHRPQLIDEEEKPGAIDRAMNSLTKNTSIHSRVERGNYQCRRAEC
jgi:hypothetical protein